jgi:hypothetical protein
MKRNLVRTTGIVGLFVIATLLFTQYVYYRAKNFSNAYSDKEIPYNQDIERSPIDRNQYLIKASKDEKFFSFFPHG